MSAVGFATLTPLDGVRLAVLSLRGVLPLRGPWGWEIEADCLDHEVPARAAICTLVVGDRAFTGYVREVHADNGRARLIFEAGVRGARAEIEAQGYESVLVSTLIEQIAADAGETLEPFTSTVVLERYTRAAGPAGVALSQVTEAHELGWRFTDEGSIRVAAETWDATPETGLLVMREHAAEVELAPLSPSLSPGETFQGRKIERVIYVLPEGGSLTARAVFERTDSGADMRGMFERAVRAAIRELVYTKRWPSRVVGQAEDGRLELTPDDADVPPTPPVPPLYGLPGVRCEVPAGSRVGLVHDGASAERPRAEGWDQSAPATLIEIEAAERIKFGAAATRGVVRLDDLGAGGTFVAVASPTLIYTSPDGLTSWQITGAVAGPSVNFTVVPVLGTPGALVTKATEASSKVVSE